MSQTIKIDSNERGKLCEAVIRKANSTGLIVERQQLIVGDDKITIIGLLRCFCYRCLWRNFVSRFVFAFKNPVTFIFEPVWT